MGQKKYPKNVNPKMLLILNQAWAKVLSNVLETNDLDYSEALEKAFKMEPEAFKRRLDVRTINALLDEFTSTVESNNDVLLLWRDDEYSNFYPRDVMSYARVVNESAPLGVWKFFNEENSVCEEVILKTTQKMYFSQAIETFTAMYRDGLFKELGTYRFISLEEIGRDGNEFWLVCDRRADGKLRLYFKLVDAKNLCHGLNCAWFEKKTT